MTIIETTYGSRMVDFNGGLLEADAHDARQWQLVEEGKLLLDLGAALVYPGCGPENKVFSECLVSFVENGILAFAP